MALEVDAEAVEDVQRRLEPRAVLIDGGSFLQRVGQGGGGDLVGGGPSSGVEGAGWAASGGGAGRWCGRR